MSEPNGFLKEHFNRTTVQPYGLSVDDTCTSRKIKQKQLRFYTNSLLAFMLIRFFKVFHDAKLEFRQNALFVFLYFFYFFI